MNLKNMAVKQEILDKRIREEHGIDYDTSNLKIIAFKVEFGEFLNEVRFFKFWSKDKEPRVFKRIKCPTCHATGYVIRKICTDCDNPRGGIKTVYPMKEEFVDGIHFLLSIGIERKYIKWVHALEASTSEDKSPETLALDIYSNPMDSAGKWLKCVEDYLYLGELVGINEEMIEAAYMEKNAENHARQDRGY